MIHQFFVPGKVMGKQRFRFTRTGHTYTPKKTTDYENYIKGCYLQNHKKILASRVNIEIYANMHNYLAKPDADNIMKVVMDALTGIYYRDDSVVISAVVTKRPLPKNIPEYLQIELRSECKSGLK